MSENKKRRISEDSTAPDNYEAILTTMLAAFEKNELTDFLVKIGSKDTTVYQNLIELIGASEKSRKLFVRSIPRETTDDSFENAFKHFGDIENFNLVRDRTTNMLKGYAFITFRDCQAAYSAVDTPVTINGKEVKVQYSELNNKKKEGEMMTPSTTTTMSMPIMNSNQDPNDPAIKRRLFVRHINYQTSDETLQKAFSEYGEIEDCKIVRNKDGTSKGYGFITYATETGANNALKFNSKTIDDTSVAYNLACLNSKDNKSNKSNNYVNRNNRGMNNGMNMNNMNMMTGYNTMATPNYMNTMYNQNNNNMNNPNAMSNDSSFNAQNLYNRLLQTSTTAATSIPAVNTATTPAIGTTNTDPNTYVLMQQLQQLQQQQQQQQRNIQHPTTTTNAVTSTPLSNMPYQYNQNQYQFQ